MASYELKQMKNGYWIEVVDGKGTLAVCHWLVRVASGNPEPDSIEDTYVDVECGARITWYGDEGSSFRCEAGHEHHSYVATEGRWEFEQEQRERYEETGSIR